MKTTESIATKDILDLTILPELKKYFKSFSLVGQFTLPSGVEELSHRAHNPGFLKRHSTIDILTTFEACTTGDYTIIPDNIECLCLSDPDVRKVFISLNPMLKEVFDNYVIFAKTLNNLNPVIVRSGCTVHHASWLLLHIHGLKATQLGS